MSTRLSDPRADSRLVYIVDDDDAFRDSLRWLLESAGFRVEAHAGAESFLAAVRHGAGVCLVLDVRMPGISGPELQEELAKRALALPLIFVTGHGDVPMAVNAIKNGAFDFIEKPFHDEDLLALIERAAGAGSAGQAREARLATLTEREREVLLCVTAGKRNKQIADELGISIKTVEAHRAKGMEKTGAASVAELVQLILPPHKTP